MNYTETVKKVMDLLNAKDVCWSSRKSHRECYASLESFMNEKNVGYSEDIRDNWIAFIKASLPGQKCAVWIRYIYQLEEMDSTGTVSNRSLYLTQSSYDKLSASWKKDLDIYLDDCRTRYTERTLALTRIYCSEGLLLLEEFGIHCITDISYKPLFLLLNSKMYCSEDTRNAILNNTSRLIRFYEEKGTYPKKYSLLFNKSIYDHIGYADEFSADSRTALSKPRSAVLSVNEFRCKIPVFVDCLKSHGYIGTSLYLARHSLTAFCLFLDINNLDYHPDVLWIWFSEIQKTPGHSWLHWRRLLSLCEEYLVSGDIIPDGKFKYNPTAFDRLPEWCRDAITGLLRQKRREFKEEGTIKAYCCSCTGFCRFLTDHGYENFQQLNQKIIKEFAVQSKHLTFRGRAGNFVIVRAFLRFLDEQGYTACHDLDLCLISGSAPEDRIIDVLSDEQIQKIYKFRKSRTAPIDLRDAAIVLLGLKTGLRAYDILSLRFQDIDWKQRQISIIMKKTKTQLTLPMPVEVGNAVYSYIKSGRPDADTEYIFVRSKAPHGKLTSKVCTQALYRILPERKSIKGGGFHVTRRTFATNLLRNHAGIDEVMDALGHRDPTSVMKYLLLDDERSRKCGLSMKDIGISPNEGLV